MIALLFWPVNQEASDGRRAAKTKRFVSESIVNSFLKPLREVEAGGSAEELICSPVISCHRGPGGGAAFERKTMFWFLQTWWAFEVRFVLRAGFQVPLIYRSHRLKRSIALSGRIRTQRRLQSGSDLTSGRWEGVWSATCGHQALQMKPCS